MMDFAGIQTKLIKKLRGEVSQKELSEELGYSFNQVNKWEARYKRFLWSDFVEVCRHKNYPVEEAFRQSYCYMKGDILDSSKIVFCLKRESGATSVEELASKVHQHSSTLRRWLSGAIEPNMESILAMMALNPSCMAAFFSELFGGEDVNLMEDLVSFNHQKEFEARYPAACAVQCCLRTEEYIKSPHHSAELIAEQILVPKKEVEEILNLLEEEGLVKKVDGKYVPTRLNLEMRGLDKKMVANIARYWSYRGYLRFCGDDGPVNTNSRPNYVGHRVAPMSEDAMAKVTEKLVQCYSEILEIIENDDKPPVDVRVLLFNHFGAEDMPEQYRPKA